MIVSYIPCKRALRSALLVLLLCMAGVFAPAMMAQWTYSYSPDLGEYVPCGSGVYNHQDINYSGCSLKSNYRNWSEGHVRVRLDSHNTSTGAMVITVEKCDENYYFQQSGKIIVVGSNSNYQKTILLCTTYSSGYHSITRSISSSDYHDGYGNYIFVFLINSAQTSYLYAGAIFINATCDPEATTLDPDNVTANSARLRGRIEPNGNMVEWQFQYGISSFYENVVDGSYSVSGSTSNVNVTVHDLEPGTTYKCRLKAWVAGNGSSYDYGGTKYFTTLTANQVTFSNPNPSDYATNTSLYPTLSWSCSAIGNPISYYEVYLRTPDYSFEHSYTTSQTSQIISESLDFNQMYYWRVVAVDTQGNRTESPLWHFTTKAGESPWAITYGATVNGTSVTLTGKVNPRNLQTNYYFEYGTTQNYGYTYGQGILPASNTTSTVTTTISGLSPNTYHYRIVAYNSAGTDYGTDKTFTIDDQCYFTDCTSGEVQTAAHYLCERGIVTGDAGAHTLRPNDDITRAELAKASFFGLYSNSSGVNIPNPLVTDYFPCIYPDLQENSYYYQAAKALLYLEYGDGRSPFDRDKSCFNPNGTIKRRHVLKVLLETFNIPPAEFDGEEPFYPYYLHDEDGWGYVKKAKDLNILNLEGTTDPHPWDNCTRGQAFLFLYRILLLIDNNTITKPTPNYDTYNPLNSDFFVPTNLSPQVANAIRGVEFGNFNYYEKDFFNILGYMNLNFGISYNSYLTEMPDEFYPVKPMGKAWTHTYDMYMNIIMDNYNNTAYYVFHMQDGALLIYNIVNGALAKFTEGNYYTLSTTTPNASAYTLKSTGQISYTFTKKSDGIYYLTKIKDRNNNAITISVGSAGSHYRVNSVSTLGRTLTFGYTSDTLLSYVKDPTNRFVRFYYYEDNNPLKQLSTVKDAKNQITWFHYGTLDSEKGLLKEIQMPKGNYVYNDYQRRKLKSMSYVEITNQNVTHTDIAITPNYQNGTTVSSVIEKVNDNQSVTINYTMNDKNQITHVTDNLNNEMSYQYGVGYPNNPDLLTKKTDNKTGLQTSYAYDASNGLMTSVTYSDGSESHNMHVVYNDYNDIMEYTDANNNTTYYGYNPSTHNLTSITDALGKTTNITNNGYGVPTRVTNPMGVYVDYSYNNYGNLEEISLPSLNLTATLTYDGISRMTYKTDFANRTTHYTYDNNDNLLSITDADGNTTTCNYDANDNVDWIQNALGKKTNFTYDSNTDFPTSMSFQGATRSYTFNRDGSLNSFTNPNGQTFNYTYNNSGELAGDGYTSMQYYSGTGQLYKVTKDGNPITYTYDSFGRISSIAYDGKTVSYTYDNNNNVKKIIYPGSKTVTYTYDALNRMTSVKDWNNNATNYYYRDDGQLNYYQYPNGVRTTYSYDNSGRCNGFSTKRNSGSGSVIAEYSFEFDNVGNHISETFTEPYESYSSIPTDNVTYSYNAANRLTSAGDLSFTYDANGNTLTRTGRTYNYDVYDQLTTVTGDFSASYTYDGLGNRRMATRNGLTTKYVLNLQAGTPTVLMETDANGSVLNYYIYGASGLISRIDASNNTRYYVYDFRGSTVAMTDATNSANITHKYQYDDFGTALQSEEADLNRFRYVGKFGVVYEDNALTYMRARYYDPEIGHFLSEDPIWNTNLYPYAENNPIMRVDPIGEFWSSLISWGASGLKWILYGSDQLETEIANNVGLEVLGQNNAGVGWAGAVYSVTDLIVSMRIHYLDRKLARMDFQIANQTAALKLEQERKKKAAQADHKAHKDIKQVDPEALNWMLRSTDPFAQQLKSLWYKVTKKDSWSESKKYEYREMLIKHARTYMTR